MAGSGGQRHLRVPQLDDAPDASLIATFGQRQAHARVRRRLMRSFNSAFRGAHAEPRLLHIGAYLLALKIVLCPQDGRIRTRLA